jgi:osmotically-inducible protein OsmY
VETKRGVVTLKGHAASKKEVNQVVAIARSIPGVLSVESHLDVKTQ